MILSISKDIPKAFSEVTAASRIYTLICLGLYIFVVGLCVYALTSNVSFSLCSGLLLSSGLGVYLESILVRTEVLSALFVFLALYFLLSAAKGTGPTVFIQLIAAGFTAYLAMLTKTQSIFLLLALPVLAVCFGVKGKTDSGLNKGQFGSQSLYLQIVLLVAALIVGAWVLLFFSSLSGGTFQSIKAYHLFTLGWIFVWMLVFVLSWKRSFSGLLLAFLSICIGIFVGMMLNLVRPELEAQKSVFHYFDSMSSFMIGTNEKERSSAGLWSMLSLSFVRMLKANFTFEGLSEYPFALLSWLSVVLIAFLARAKLYKEAIQSISILGLALLLDVVFRYRWIHYNSILFTSYYYIYTDPFLVLSVVYSLFVLWPRIKKRWLIKLPLFAFMILVMGNSLRYNYALFDNGYFPFYDHRQSMKDYCRFLKDYSPDVFEVIDSRGSCELVLKK